MQKPHTNDTDIAQYAADGTLVQPGQTRMVRDLSGLAPDVPVPNITDPMQDLSRESAVTILSRLIGLDVHQLAALQSFEAQGQDRGEVIELIKLRTLELEDAEPDAKVDGDGDAVLQDIAALTVGEIADELVECNDAQLARLAEIEAAGEHRKGVAAAIKAEQDKRAAG